MPPGSGVAATGVTLGLAAGPWRRSGEATSTASSPIKASTPNPPPASKAARQGAAPRGLSVCPVRPIYTYPPRSKLPCFSIGGLLGAIQPSGAGAGGEISGRKTGIASLTPFYRQG